MPDRNGYIGRAPSDSSVTVARQSYTSSGITTDFTFASGYVVGYFDLYVNGVKMIEGSDYTSTDGSTFSVLNGGASDGDVLEAVAYKAFNAATIDTAPGNLTVGSNLTVGGSLTVTGAATLGAGTSVSFATTAFNLDGTPNITVGVATASSFVKSGGTSAQFLKADGSVDSSTYISSVGIESGGTSIGNATTLNFIGAGNTFAVNGSTIDVSIQGGGGGGGAELDVTASLFI